MNPVARYGVLRAQVLKNLVLRSGVPAPLLLVGGVIALGLMLQFAALLGASIAAVHDSGETSFLSTLGITFFACQLVFSFVVIGSVSIRLFDPRRIAEIDVFSALPLTRLQRFFIQVSDVAALPIAMVAILIAPAMLQAARIAGMSPVAGIVLATMATAMCLQPLPLFVGGYALVLRLAPPIVLRSRWLLFAGFALLVTPIVPVLLAIFYALQAHAVLPGWMPAAWAAQAVVDADAGRWAAAAKSGGAELALTALLCVAAFVAYDRAFLERFDEVLAKLTLTAPIEDAMTARGRARRRIEADVPARDTGRAALLKKELLGYWRDPALQLTMAALAASAALFSLLPLGQLGVMASGGVAQIAVYTACCLGLASFSVEGRGFPVLAPLPLAVDDVLKAKLVVNTLVLAIAGAAGGGAVGLAAGGGITGNPILGIVGAAAGAIVAAPLGGLVTAMAALFPRRLQRTGRREISPFAMSFFTALSGLFYASTVAAILAPSLLGLRYVWLPAVVLVAWTIVSAALVSAARKAVRRGGTEG